MPQPYPSAYAMPVIVKKKEKTPLPWRKPLMTQDEYQKFARLYVIERESHEDVRLEPEQPKNPPPDRLRQDRAEAPSHDYYTRKDG